MLFFVSFLYKSFLTLIGLIGLIFTPLVAAYGGCSRPKSVLGMFYKLKKRGRRSPLPPKGTTLYTHLGLAVCAALPHRGMIGVASHAAVP